VAADRPCQRRSKAYRHTQFIQPVARADVVGRWWAGTSSAMAPICWPVYSRGSHPFVSPAKQFPPTVGCGKTGNVISF
jgi:hypothetical protein